MKSINISIVENCMAHIHNLDNIIEELIYYEQDMRKRSLFIEINSYLALIKTKLFDSKDCFMIELGNFMPRKEQFKIRDAFYELMIIFYKKAFFNNVKLNIEFEESVPEFCFFDKSRL
jgi:hypothetical protein